MSLIRNGADRTTENRRRSLHSIVLMLSTLLGSWLAMQAVHELGHVVAALISGGSVAQVVLHPATISRTDLAANPHPLLVAWAGPIIGIAVPLLLWGLAVAFRFSAAFVPRFFAGFCLIANGLYIGGGSFSGVGDCGEMLRHGSSPWQLWLFGAVASPLGLWLWHGLAPQFGLGPEAQPVSRRLAYGSLLVCLALLALAWLVGGE